jgi:hypothetical protein
MSTEKRATSAPEKKAEAINNKVIPINREDVFK